MNAFSNLSNRTKTLMVVCGVSLLLLLFYGFKDAGGVNYYGNYYDAGSLMSPEEYSYSGLGSNFDNDLYGNLANAFGGGDPDELNQQLGELRVKNLFLVLGFGIATIVTGRLLLKEEEFREFLIEIRGLRSKQ